MLRHVVQGRVFRLDLYDWFDCTAFDSVARFKLPEGSPRACQTLLLHFAFPAHLSPAKGSLLVLAR